MLTAKQKEYIRNANHRWNFKTGATGSGKTYMDILYTIPARLRERHGLSGLNVLMGNTKGTLQRNIIEPLQEQFSPALVSSIGSDNTAILFGEKCYCLGADKINQVSKIQGATIKYCYGDEVTTWSENVFIMLKSRLRTPQSCFDGTCNPDTPSHWLKQFLDSDADIYHQPYVIDDGVLPPGTVAELKKEYAGTVYYNRFILGQWCAAEGVIYRTFADSVAAGGDRRFLWPETKPLKLWKIHIGVDFGGNGSRHAFVATGVLPGYSGAVILASQRIEASGKDADDLAQKFLLFAQTVFTTWGEINAVFCDNAEQVLIQHLRTSLLRSRLAWLSERIYNAAKIEINDRIRLTSILMGGGRFWYLPQAETARDALSTALWSDKHIGIDERLDDGTTDIDTCDAFEYTIERDYKRYLRIQ